MEPRNRRRLEEMGCIIKEELAELARRAGWFLVGAAIVACVAAAILGGVLLSILYSRRDRERQRAAEVRASSRLHGIRAVNPAERNEKTGGTPYATGPHRRIRLAAHPPARPGEP